MIRRYISGLTHNHRHCERSEAIQECQQQSDWIATPPAEARNDVVGKSRIFLIVGLLALSACAGQTFEKSEPYTQKPHHVESQEDRIVLALPENPNAPLSKEYQDYIGRFVAYYRDMPHAIFYVSHIQSAVDQELADGDIPAFRPGVEHQIRQVTAALDALKIHHHRIVEQAHDQEATNTEENKPTDVKVDDKLDTNKKVAVAVIVRQYTVTAGGCVDLSKWRFDRVQTTSMSAVGIGCSTRQNYLAQMKNPQNVVQGQTMDPEYETMPFVKLKQKVLDGSFKPKEAGSSDSGGSGVSGSGGQ